MSYSSPGSRWVALATAIAALFAFAPAAGAAEAHIVSAKKAARMKALITEGRTANRPAPARIVAVPTCYPNALYNVRTNTPSYIYLGCPTQYDAGSNAYKAPTITVTSGLPAAAGTITADEHYGFEYMPAQGYKGDTSFAVKVVWASGDEASYTLNIHVGDDVNSAPSCFGDGFPDYDENEELVSMPMEVRANSTGRTGDFYCSDDDGDKLTVTLGATSGGGTVALGPAPTEDSEDRTFVYTPKSGAAAGDVDSFDLTVTDDWAAAQKSEKTTVDVAIVASTYNTAPYCTIYVYDADGYSFELENNEVARIDEWCYDGEGDPVSSFTVADDPSDDDADLDGPAHGTFGSDAKGRTFTPEAGYAGPDEFFYVNADNPPAPAVALTSEVDFRSLSIIAGKSAPTCPTQTIEVAHDTAKEFMFTCNDADGQLVGVSWSHTDHGTIEVVSYNGSTRDRTWRYTPKSGFSGTEVVTLYPYDENDDGPTATLTFNVAAAPGTGTGTGSGTGTTTDPGPNLAQLFEQLKQEKLEELLEELGDLTADLAKDAKKGVEASGSFGSVDVGFLSENGGTASQQTYVGTPAKKAQASKATVVSASTVTVAKGGKGALKLKLNKKGKALLKKKKTLKVTVVVTAQDALTKATQTTTKKLTLKAKKAKKKKKR